MVSVSVKVPPVRATELLLVMVNVIVDVPSAVIVAGENALLISGRLSVVSDAFTPLASIAPDAGSPEIRAALLRYAPCVAAVTSTLMVQLATPALMPAPALTVTVLPAAGAVRNTGLLTCAPPAGQLLFKFGVAATTTPAGSESINERPVCAGLPAPLVRLNVSVLTPPAWMVVGTNAFVSVVRETDKH